MELQRGASQSTRSIVSILFAGATFFLHGCEVEIGPQEPTLGGTDNNNGTNGGIDIGIQDGMIQISEAELRDKIHGFWVGQLVGNFMGLPFEFSYIRDPMPILPTKYYDEQTAKREGLTTYPGSIPGELRKYGGAYTDDDTDIEFVTLHAVEKHGLDITYSQIADAWKEHVKITLNGKDALWFANKRALENMYGGRVPPETGSKSNNQYWWTIDPQLVNEIWSVWYPGMVDKAVEKAEWGARITSSDWGTHPTRFYAALYSASFVTKDIPTLYDLAMSYVPDGSPFKTGLKDVKSWYESNRGDWKGTRQHIYNNYRRYPSNCGDDKWDCAVSAIINGLLGAMALLHGEGDFMRTVGIAIAAGYDCDNQAATLAGLLGTMNGLSGIPRAVTHQADGIGDNWGEAFNNKYINDRRPGLPRDNTITGIVDKIMQITKRAIHDNGGSQSGTTYSVKVSGMSGRR